MSERITLVEIDLKHCSLDYGVGNCAASIPATGTKKCFNCWATCQDKDNFDEEFVTVRYSDSSANMPTKFEALPNLASLSIRPQQLGLGESIGVRASVSMSFKDHRSPDTGPDGDKYLSSRSYDPFTVGTYWGKFRARYPFVRGSKLRVIRGDTDQTLDQMETRHFIVDNIAGPNSSGGFTINAKDMLNLAKGKQSQVPEVTGDELAADFIIGANDFSVIGGVDPLIYTVGSYINLGGKEIVQVNSINTGNGTVNCTRAKYNTDEIDHKDGDRIQKCAHFGLMPPDQIIAELLTGYADIPPEYIPADDWAAESSTYIDRNYTGLIAEPTAVDSVINEVLQQSASTLWWDDISQLLRWRVLRAVNPDAATYNDDFNLSGSFSAKDQPQKRVSQVWTYYGQINPLDKLNETQNYSSTVLTVSPGSEIDFSGEKSIKKIFSRWIPKASDVPSRLNNLILSRYSTPPRLISLSLQQDVNLIRPEVGGGYNCENWTLQTDEGQAQTVPIQLTQVKSTGTGYSIIGEEVLYSEEITPDDPTIKNIPIDTSAANVNLYDYAIAGGFTFNPGDTAIFTLSAGAAIYSDTTAVPALVTGDQWPAGMTLELINNGAIFGRGGDGGSGGQSSRFQTPDDNGKPGLNGGNGFTAQHGITVVNNGLFAGGGGGGGGAGIAVVYANGEGQPYYYAFLGGGGGGAGGGLGLGGHGGDTNFGPTMVLNGATPAYGGSFSGGFYGGDGGVGAIWPDWNGAGGTGATGGQLGANGPAGGNGVFPGNSFQGRIGYGGAGGLAGSAIDKNGHAVTITGWGDVYGAINN